MENCTGVPCITAPPAPSFTCGTSTVTDVDNNTYNTVVIGTQCWTKENLKVIRYNDGTSIYFDNTGGPTGNAAGEDWERVIGAYTIYANEASTDQNATIYGFLYNWYAATDSRKICPAGWHVPTDDEWTTLTTFLGGESMAGGKMKDDGMTYWNSPNTGATNETFFSALPGGRRGANGRFNNIATKAHFWSANESNDNRFAWQRELSHDNGNVIRISSYRKPEGASIRCLRD